MPRGATPADTTEIAVQGVVSFNRRNYRMLVDVCREFANTPRPPSILFNILGDSTIRDGPPSGNPWFGTVSNDSSDSIGGSPIRSSPSSYSGPTI